MRKKKRKLSNFLMVVLLLFVFYYLYIELSAIKVTADKLVSDYASDILAADKKYLNKEIELTSTFEAYFEFKDDHSLIELNSGSDEIGLYCIIDSTEHINFIDKLTSGSKVTVNGICLGFTENKFPNSLYISVKDIK